MLQNLEENDWLCPELFECSARDVFLSRDAAYSDESTRNDCPLDNIVHGYFADPAEVDSKIVMYGGFYAFDMLDIVMISNGEVIKFLIRDKVDQRMSEAILQKNELYESIFCLLQSLDVESASN